VFRNFASNITPDMMNTIKFGEVEDKIVRLRNLEVILDRDVAALYGVQTMRINEAVKNNPDKFPTGYIFELTPNEKAEVIEIFDNPSHIVLSPALPKAFTEKGLYMLATILKSSRATQTTLAIVEAFAQIRELARTVAELSNTTENFKQQSLMEKGGGILGELLGGDLQTTDTETTFEVNFAMLKLKHTIKRKEKE
jgi:hypothetical protein